MNIFLDFKDIPVKLDDKCKLTRNYFNSTNVNLLDIDICNQGIKWSNVRSSRETLRKQRLKHHKGFRNKPETTEERAAIDNFFDKVPKDIFYQFNEMHTGIPVSVQHFQLRKNLKMLSETQIVYIRTFGIEKMNLVTDKRTFLVLFANEEMENQTKVVNFDICRRDGKLFIVCGKLDGNVILYIIQEDEINIRQRKDVPAPLSVIRKRVSEEGEFQITNNVKFLENGTKLLICSNDSHIRIYDLLENDFKLLKVFKAPNAINHCAINYSQSVLAAVGDFETVELYDYNSEKSITQIHGHSDFGFAAYFQPKSDYTLFTGNQDYSCKVWDIRKSSDNCINTLYGHFDTIGELTFIKDEFLVYSENTDFLHFYNLKSGSLQSFEYFGSAAGVVVHPLTQKIYLTVHEYDHFGVMTFDKINDNIININALSI